MAISRSKRPKMGSSHRSGALDPEALAAASRARAQEVREAVLADPEDDLEANEVSHPNDMVARRIAFLVVAGASDEDLMSILGLTPNHLDCYRDVASHATLNFIADALDRLHGAISQGDMDATKYALACMAGWDPTNEPKSTKSTHEAGKALPPLVRKRIEQDIESVAKKTLTKEQS
jgi:hypothetical protein